MNQIVLAKMQGFTAKVNKVIAESATAVEIRSVDCAAGGEIAALLVSDGKRSSQVPGSLLEVSLISGKPSDVAAKITAKSGENPCFRPLHIFVKAGEGAGVIAVCGLHQP